MLHDSTEMMFISLMLIGGGPVSPACGIKITTFVVMIIATVAFFRGQQQLHAFSRSSALDQVLKIMALTAISVILVFVGTSLLAASREGHFLDISFEIASACGCGRFRPTPYVEGSSRRGLWSADQLFAVSGSMICGTSVIFVIGMPLSSACRRIASSPSAR